MTDQLGKVFCIHSLAIELAANGEVHSFAGQELFCVVTQIGGKHHVRQLSLLVLQTSPTFALGPQLGSQTGQEGIFPFVRAVLMIFMTNLPVTITIPKNDSVSSAVVFVQNRSENRLQLGLGSRGRIATSGLWSQKYLKAKKFLQKANYLI